MGKITNGLFNGITGKIGNLVYYKIGNKEVIRTIGKSSKPPTEKQLACRLGFKVTLNFLNAVAPFINIGFYRATKKLNMYPRNRATSHIKRNALTGTYPEIRIDYSKVLVSEGSLLVAKAPFVRKLETGLEFSWEPEMERSWCTYSDRVMMMAYFPRLNRAIYELYGAKREVGAGLLKIEPVLLDEHIETYIAFVSEDQNNVSTSIYTGRLN